MENKEPEFTNLVREHKTTIYTVCYMFSKDSQEIEDLFQEVLVKIWQGFGSFRGESDVRTWIYRVALNTCINADKKKKRAGEKVPLSVDIDPFEDTNDKALQTKQLYSRINRLGLVDRSIVLLWLEGISYDEIGQIVGISAQNVSVKLVRIREQLKQMDNGR
ncbi:MAG: sigma-70 family RNA polymerase sigma factor [Bacteroidia bacterium]|nr:sigma-70 family RNA polymerase sigma factor [Bacteroidia bacterium]